MCGRISYIYHSSYVKCELEKIIECDGLILNPEKEIQSPSDGKDIYGHACVLSKVCTLYTYIAPNDPMHIRNNERNQTCQYPSGVC